MRCRKFSVESDYPVLLEWWKHYSHGILSPAILPETGVAVVDDNDVPLAFSWLYFTNSRCAIIDWTIANPHAPLMTRGRAISAAVQNLEALASTTNVAVIFGFSGYRGFTKTMLRLGYKREGQPCDVMMKQVKED